MGFILNSKSWFDYFDELDVVIQDNAAIDQLLRFAIFNSKSAGYHRDRGTIQRVSPPAIRVNGVNGAGVKGTNGVHDPRQCSGNANQISIGGRGLAARATAWRGRGRGRGGMAIQRGRGRGSQPIGMNPSNSVRPTPRQSNANSIQPPTPPTPISQMRQPGMSGNMMQPQRAMQMQMQPGMPSQSIRPRQQLRPQPTVQQQPSQPGNNGNRRQPLNQIQPGMASQPQQQQSSNVNNANGQKKLSKAARRRLRKKAAKENARSSA